MRTLSPQRYQSRFIEMTSSCMETIKLGDLVELPIKKAKTKYKSSDTIEYIDISSIDEESKIFSRSTKYIFSEAPSRAQQCVITGDILYSTVRPSLRNFGVITCNSTNLVASSGFCVLRPKQGMNEYILAVISSESFTQKMVDKSQGGVFPSVNQSFVLEQQIPWPPKTIRDELSNLYEQADKSKFGGFKSRFIEMFSAYPNNYIWKDVVTITNGKKYPGEYFSSGTYPICGSGGIMHYGELKLCEGETIIIGRKGNINTPLYMKDSYWIVDTAFSINTDRSKLLPIFFYFWCTLFDFTKLNKQAVLPSLTKTDLENIKICCPPLELQKEFESIYLQADKSK